MTANVEPTASKNRIPEIDALRGICAATVMLYHYIVRYDALIGFSGHPNPAADVNLTGFRDWGLMPVYVFFIISGFVIYMTVSRIKTGTQFVVSRASRLFPVYWVAVTLTYLTWKLAPAYAFTVPIKQYLINLTMLQTFFMVPSVDGVYWSLGVELAFYFGMWLLVFTGNLNKIRGACLVWLVVSFLYGVLGDHPPFYFRAVLLMDLKYAHFFVAGIVFYRMWRRQHDLYDWLSLAACAGNVFVHHTPGAALVLLGFFGVFLLVSFNRLKALAWPPLLYLGMISYPLYLIHQMIGYEIISAVSSNHFLGIVIAVVTAIVLASILTFAVEQPALRALRSAMKRGLPASSPTVSENAEQAIT